MPQESQLAHRNVRNTALPYRTNVSPSATDPYYALGSKDLLTSIAGYAERRPGFAATVETTPTAFHNLQRLFSWDRNDGTFFVMACDINASGFAQVYKLQVGADASFVSIFTDTVGTPFDFVTSNNTLYFSNGNVAKKWDPVNGLSNWGIAIGSVSNVIGPNAAGNGANFASGFPPNWTNPNNITSSVTFATVSVTANNVSNWDQGTQFSFSIPATNTILGIALSFKANATGGTFSSIGATLLKAGGFAGVVKNQPVTSTLTTYTLGGTSDLWGTTWVANDINQTTFGVQFQASGGSSGTAAFKLNSVTITIYSLGGPPVTLVAGGFSPAPTTGFYYEFCYGNSNTGHISSPTPLSSLIKPDGTHSVQIGLTASTDSQVNQIRVFRSTDGGAGTYFELPTSPYPNTTANVVDAAADTSLNISSIAPTTNFNDPPTPGRGAIYYSGRIFLFNGNKDYFSGLEEIVQGVPEESFPSGIAGNFWAFDQPLQAQAVAGTGQNQTLGTYSGGRINGIVGNTLDTFQRFNVSQRRGCRNVACTTSLGGMVAWFDSASQIWATNGSDLQELSTDIRPDLVGLNPATCSMTFHVSSRFHWLVFSTGTKLYVYDMDTEQWMPPWSFSCNYVFSGEISPGNYVLMAATPTKALQLSTTNFNDNGTTYQPIMKIGNLAVVPDFGTRFSYLASGIYDEPSRTGYPVTFQITNNAQALFDVLILNDEDPTQGTYTSIVQNVQDTATTYNRTNGTFMKQWIYPTTGPASRWISAQIKLVNRDQVDKVYEFFMAYKPMGGR